MKDRLHQECYARSCWEIEECLKDVAIKGKYWKKRKRLEEFPSQHDQESRTMSLFFYDPDSLSSYDVPTFIKLLLPRVQEKPAAKLECREIHERIWVFLETFLIFNMLDDILKNYTMIKEIWQHHRETLMMSKILRKEGIENSGREELLQSIPLPCFSVRARKSRRQISLMCMTNHALNIWTCTQVAWQFRVISPPRWICKKSLTKRNFRAESWISEQMFAQKRRISRSYCSGSRDRSNQLAEGPYKSKINNGKKIHLIMEN